MSYLTSLNTQLFKNIAYVGSFGHILFNLIFNVNSNLAESSANCSASYPGLYVRVKNYLGWIKKHAASGACAKIVQAKITTKKKKKPRRKKKKKCGRKKKMKCRKKKDRTTTTYYYYLLELLELLEERGKGLRILW